MSSVHSPRGISICEIAAIKLAIYERTVDYSVARLDMIASLTLFLKIGSRLSQRS